MTLNLTRWQDDMASNAASIACRKSDFKILLKTKNDRWLLDEWIEHHAAIVGINSLIIFDNESDDEGVLGTYERFGADLLVFSFSGHHNNLHFVDKNRELYRAIAESCKFFIFLDTDEFLQWIDEEGRYDRNISTHLSPALTAGGSFICGVWLPNVAGDAARYWVGEDRQILRDGVRWGKPLLKSDELKPAFINHNVQAYEAGLSPVSCGSLIVQHRNRLYREQRIMSNINKLRQRNIEINVDDSEARIRRLLSDASDPNITLYLNEILGLRTSQADPKYERGFVEFGADGRLKFPTELERNLILSSVAHPDEVILMALGASVQA